MVAVLMRIWLCFLLKDIAEWFDTIERTVSEVLTTWFKVLAVELEMVFS